MKLTTTKNCEIANKILQALNNSNITSEKQITVTVTLTKADGKIKDVTVTQ